jgi:hypothetical protein
MSDCHNRGLDEPPPRGQQRGNGQKVRRHSLDRLHASMNKQKKKTTEAWTRVATVKGLFGMTRSLGNGYDVLFRYYAGCMKEV